MTPTLGKILAGAAAAVLLVGLIAWGMDHYHQALGNKDQQQAQEFKGEANALQKQAQQAPDHAQELAAAKADVAGARAEVARLRAVVEAERRSRVPDPAGPAAPEPAVVVPDHRDEFLAADAVLIAKQDADIQKLTTALADKTAEADTWHKAHDLREKQAMAQEAATDAWKKAVTESRWRGRVEGFAAGVALGFVGGRRG